MDGSDPSVILVEVTKLGGGAGNGVGGASAIVIELPFMVDRAGTTGLTVVGQDNGGPEALDSQLTSIDAVTFDAANAAVTASTTGGGGY